MCGITGIVDPTSSSTEIRAVLQRMTDVIIHRGPDDEGFFTLDGIGLGMRRLSIIDLSSGKQPIFNEDKSIVIVFNGEVYNYLELRKQLQSRGHFFTTNSDTEVIVHLYEDFGDDCVQHLRGMFAFSIWDIRRNRLLIARDRLGIKPLYYVQTDNRLIFGSEIKAILEHPAIQAQPNLTALNNFLSLKYVPAPQTMFDGIAALPPGYLMTGDKNGVNVRQYWDLSFAPNNQPVRYTEAVCAEQLEGLLKESVKSHLMSDVPFGAFLSGGIDSSTIVALMSQFLGEPVKTFSVGYGGDGEEYSELPYARMVAEKYKTDHHEIIISPQDFINLTEKIVWHLDQPIADQASLATYMVSELASHYVKMVLTGEGGDELFAGYARYAGEKFSPIFQYLPKFAKSLALGLSNHVPGLRRAKLALYALCQPDEVTRLTNWFPLINYDKKLALLSDELKTELVGISSDTVFAEQLARTDAKDRLSRMLYIDTKLWLPDDLLARGDKMSMAVSIEGRVPLLDHKLVEFAASLPPGLKVKGLARKYLLKEVSKKWLPPEIISRKKRGFPMPLSIWLRKEARSFARDTLSSQTIRKRKLFNPVFVENILQQHETGFANHETLIWSLINIELWYRLYIDR